MWFISQQASTESIQFLGHLRQILGGPLTYYLQILPSGHWHIRILCRDWLYIINTIIPYFNQLYVEKYTGMLKLARIYKLLSEENLNSKIELINLAYSITSSKSRKIPLLEKISVVTGLSINEIKFSSQEDQWGFNERPINLIWVLGFMLGDGNIYVRIRDTKVGLEYIPIFRMTQKNTSDNGLLYTKLLKFGTSLELGPIIKTHKENLEWHIFGKANVTSLMSMLSLHSEFFYWKFPQFTMLTKILYLLNLNIKNWLELQKTILKIIYQFPGKREYSISHWQKRLSEIYTIRFSNVEFFISAIRAKSGANKGNQIGWVVTLPKILEIRPIQKYFSLNTYGDIHLCKKAAIEYRNITLNNWLNKITNEKV